MSGKNLSIIISCHGNTPYFTDMLESFLSCGYHFNDTEILICDDASPSGGDGDKARRYANQYPQLIKCIRNEQNLGVSRSYQRLVELACGRYIMPFDSDDIFVPFDIDGAIKELDENPQWCASYGKKLLFSSEKGFLGSSHGGDYSQFALLLDPRMTHIGMLIRAADLKSSRGYQLADGSVCRVADDVCMWSAVCARKAMHFRDEIRGLYRIHQGQETKVKAQLFEQSYEVIRNNFLSEHSQTANKIVHDRSFQLAEHERFAAAVICGIKFIRSKNPAERKAYLNIATQLFPDDYGVDEYRIKDAMAQKDIPTAMLYTALMLEKYHSSLYIRSVALNFAVQLAENDVLAQKRLQNSSRECLNQFFHLTDSQKQLLKKATGREI